MEKFSYFDCPISQISDSELISWLIMFLNGADYDDPKNLELYEGFKKELANRPSEVKEEAEYLMSVL